MEETIFSSQMSMFVNGIPMKDFEVGKGLRKGYHFSPFSLCDHSRRFGRVSEEGHKNKRFQWF